MSVLFIGLAVLGGLVGLVVLIALVGLTLPRGHVASRRAVVPAAPEAVYGAIADYAAWPTWNPEVKKVERGPDRNGHAVWVIHGSFGVMPLEVLEAQPPARHKGRIVDDDLPFGGTWTYELAAESSGTRVTITEEGEVKNPIFRFLSKFVFGHTASLDAYLKALARKHGADATPVDARS